jgi:tRNA U34 2-thiouridine synthase MnmA/TrmU
MKAIALISGGLDSILAAKVIQQQGVEVIPLHFNIPFCHKAKEPGKQAGLVKENLGADLRSVDLSQEFLEVIKNPRYGFGSNMNPCIDCKILMFSRAKELMPELGAQFIVTGEVLGQRPMSQHKQALSVIPRRASLEGLVVRPLCAKLLPETIPEKEGWVRRDGLLDFSGRTRKPQFDLAQNLQVKDYAQPAGGCLLTDPEFSRRLKELIAHQELSLNNIELLKVGRHFRIATDARLAVGRNESEDNELLGLAQPADYIFRPPETAGPTSLGRGNFTEDMIELACRITCRYCDKAFGATVKISYYKAPDKEERLVEVLPADKTELLKLRV